MKIIDFEKKGNMVKFYLGNSDLTEWHGDDWNDTPYEHNAGSVYDEFIVTTKVVTFDFDDVVLEPSDGAWNGNSAYCKEDMIARKVPCICVLKKEDKEQYGWYDDFHKIVGNDKVIKFYFGDEMEADG
jgi:hypothetical protein